MTRQLDELFTDIGDVVEAKLFALDAVRAEVSALVRDGHCPAVQRVLVSARDVEVLIQFQPGP